MKDKLDTMSNKEIQIAVAQSLGWRQIENFLVPPENDPRINWAAEWNEWGVVDGNKLSIPNWMENWSENLIYAWDLVLRAEKQNVGFSLRNIKYNDDNRIVYEATLYDPWGGPKHVKYRVEAETAPRAICLAHLKMEGDKE